MIGDLPLLVHQNLKKEDSVYNPLSQISPYIKEAIISSQDERFYTNSGIDLKGTVRAIIYSVLNRRRQGASTITEQLAKNLFYNGTDSLTSDIQTKVLALYLTRKYSKNEILEFYLNTVYFGRNSYGIASASRNYFNTKPADVFVGEAAYLMGLVNAPGYLGNHPKEALNEAEVVLESLVKDNYITKKDKADAINELNQTLKGGKTPGS